MRHFIPLLAAILFVPLPLKAVAEDLKCEYERKFKGGGSKGADVRMRIAGGKIEELVLSSSFASGQEGGGYVCEINTTDKGQTTKWSVSGNKTILETGYADLRKSVVEIEPTANAYRINLEGASQDACGFGAEWPRQITVTRGNKKCSVVYNKY